MEIKGKVHCFFEQSKEEWRDIKGFEGLYQVSNLGRARSLDHYVKNGHGSRIVHGKILKQYKSSHGYLFVALGKKAKHRLVHRLVATAFIQNPNNYEQIDHIDGNPQNNKVENLRWCTAKQNQNFEKAIENKIRIHIKLEGKKTCQFSKQGVKIRTWDSISSAARTLGIARTGIRDCCLNKQKSAFGYIWKYKNNESC